MLKHTIYKTTNSINGKIYIGKHSTEDPNDSYMGSGVAFENAVKKYGKENFVKEILFTYDDEMEAFEKERELVTLAFTKRTDNYNILVGGYGAPVGEANPMWGKTWSEEHKAEMSRRNSGEGNPMFGKVSAMKGKKTSDETRKKQSESMKIHMKERPQNGENNHHYGKRHSEEAKRKIGERSRNRPQEMWKRMSDTQRARNPFYLPENKEKILSMRAEGKTYKQIAEYFIELGLKTPKGGKIRKETIRTVHMGLLKYG